MSEDTIKLLDLVNKGYTLNDICNDLNLSRDQVYKIFRKLKQVGVNFNKKYYADGELVYIPKKEIEIGNRKNVVNLITDTNEDMLRVLLASDLHIGSEYENIKALNDMYDYCIINGIKIIMVVGDFLDGINIGRIENKKHDNSFEQIRYALEKYPMDKNILNFLVLGNHDIDSLISYGIDFSCYLNNFRHDIVPVGYGNGIINIKNDKIFLAHPLCIGVPYSHELTSNYLLIKGHQHASKSIIGTNGSCSLIVPSLSNLFLTENEFLPGAIDLTIKFRDGYFDMFYYEQLMFGNRVHVVNSTQIAMSHPKDRKFDLPVKNEEEFSKRKILRK